GLEPDEVRDRLLAGFQYILVDEYQDIDEPQYELISALAGRALDDPDLKLSILAVGDDDQNIYTFRGANVAFIRRFQQDYDAEVHYLVENYRSTRHLIEAANQMISANTDRMKTGHPIRIDRHRTMLPPGGEFGQRDDLGRGRVQIVEVADDAAQSAAVIAELRRLQTLGVAEWSSIAVLSSTHRDLALVRAKAETEGIPVRWCSQSSALPPLHHVREIRRFLRRLNESRRSLARASDLAVIAEEMFAATRPNEWIQWLRRLIESWRDETMDAELPLADALEFFYETCAENRRELGRGSGVVLSTVHAAKGTEFDHVLLIGPWPLKGNRPQQEEDRRALYVGMTRARRTLAMFERMDVQPALLRELEGPAVWRHSFSGHPGPMENGRVNYTVLGLDDLHL
ncbi:MAG TPA: ATP-dependent helicase, partial [Verrucomicrobiae bacterium]|nr:ATP-dependent helicase [Verrucomicrobiae bacterium]